MKRLKIIKLKTLTMIWPSDAVCLFSPSSIPMLKLSFQDEPWWGSLRNKRALPVSKPCSQLSVQSKHLCVPRTQPLLTVTVSSVQCWYNQLWCPGGRLRAAWFLPYFCSEVSRGAAWFWANSWHCWLCHTLTIRAWVFGACCLLLACSPPPCQGKL